MALSNFDTVRDWLRAHRGVIPVTFLRFFVGDTDRTVESLAPASVGYMRLKDLVGSEWMSMKTPVIAIDTVESQMAW